MLKISMDNIIKEINDGNKIMLIICGPSGSGKSTFEKMLTTDHSNLFTKMQQATTREKRDNETIKDYCFIDKNEIEMLWNSLIARINFNENYYGTFPIFDSSKINTIIASYEGIKDIFETYPRCVAYGKPIKKEVYSYKQFNLLNEFKIKVIVLFMDIDNDDIVAKRKNRDLNFVNEERSLLQNLLTENFYKRYQDRILSIIKWNYSTHKRWPTYEDIFDGK